MKDQTFREWLREKDSSNDVKLEEAADVQPGVSLTVAKLKAGGKYFAHYKNGWNYFTDIFELVAFVIPKDGASPHDKGTEWDKYSTLAEMKKATGAKNMKELADLDARMYCKWPKDNQEGPYYYICDNKWVRGSGCDKLSFSEVVKSAE